MKLYFLLLAAASVATAQKQGYQNQQYTTPVPILKQIDKHNEDGSYSYGYEAADGTFKIETKYPDGEVYGKYGYIDDRGSLREVEYGASRRGFEPAGSEIQVPPPTLKVNPDATRPLGPNEEDDGQYREDPSVYYKDDPYYTPRAQTPQSSYQPAFTQQTYQPAPKSLYQDYQWNNYAPQPQPQAQPQPQPQPRPQPQPQPQWNNYNNYAPQPQWNNYAQQHSYYNPSPPAYPNYNQFQGHPASNVDIYTGSYSVNYR